VDWIHLAHLVVGSCDIVMKLTVLLNVVVVLVHVDEMRLCLRTAVTNGPIVYHPDDV
jgi:hypothetical protein